MRKTLGMRLTCASADQEHPTAANRYLWPVPVDGVGPDSTTQRSAAGDRHRLAQFTMFSSFRPSRRTSGTVSLGSPLLSRRQLVALTRSLPQCPRAGRPVAGAYHLETLPTHEPLSTIGSSSRSESQNRITARERCDRA